ncbi:NUDIX hydrolase [Cellulosilyticum lentocellum]|uniref:NUDIX hydrolase n=1 Tax=Cellulosilyticum lentocellum (strain ATCC 49066 / DSM 5427 / NCIMB 11756 / RHM5) TaxID=642492 RepID=F2JGE1_CELLD|nr:NUDIX domain-containing protein [Cellulosilyticum lentocellum]ADZ81836.1 NUDIX hydrolase [Cellulosilyticum lentocellum DSM 5427]
MLKVCFHQAIEDEKIKFAVIAARYKNQWIYCRHRERNTFEIPGGHREIGETIIETAKRELYEETGAIDFELEEITVYSVVNDNIETFGMLFFTEVKELGVLPDLEIEEIQLFDEMPETLTYPLIQPLLIERVKQVLKMNG